MAIFIPPRGTKESLSGIALYEGELVYNTTDKKFYTGDGVTLGGKPVFEDQTADMSQYATKADIAGLLSGELDPIFGAISGSLATTEYVNAEFAKKSDIPEISNLATKEEIAGLLSGELDPIFGELSSGFAVKSEIPRKVSELANDSDFATKADAMSYIPSGLSQFANDADYAKKSDIPEVSGFATREYAEQIARTVVNTNDNDFVKSDFAQSLIDSAVSGLASKEDIEDFVTQAVLSTTLDDYAKKIDIPEVNEFVTETDADQKYATKEDVERDYALKTDIPSEPDLSDYATKDDLDEYVSHSEAAKYAKNVDVNSKNEYLITKLAKLTKEVDALKRESSVVINSFNPVIIKPSINGDLTTNDSTVDAIVSQVEINAQSNVTLKSLDLDDSTISAEYATGQLIQIAAQEDVSITNSDIYSETDSNLSASNAIKVLSAEVFKLENVNFTGETYNNIMTGQNTDGHYLKYADIINCNFNDICKHVYIWFAGWQDNAVLNIRNCKFKSCEQMLCLADYHGQINQFDNKLTVNIENCEIENYEKNDAYEGFLYCDSRQTNSSNFETLNPFGNGKITININNVTVGGVRLTKDNFLMGTKAAGQMLYLYRAAGRALYSFDENTKNLFPTVYVDGELITQLA